METRTVEQVESWQTRSVRDGFAGLRELSDGEFSGAVRAGGAWLFMLNGRIIGVYEGSLDDFEDADGTAYAAPHPSLPLLFSMQERGGQTQAKYYTNDTPLSEVDSTLTNGKFTGFVELSENVLSGDYYVAYYGGRSMSVAFVGASEQVVTGDEAFERADDEVGIYEVMDVDIEVTDVPEPDEPEDSPDDSGTSASAGAETSGSPSDSGGVSGGRGGATGGPSTASGGADSASTAGGGPRGGSGASAGESGESPEAATSDASSGKPTESGGQSAAGTGSAVSQSTANGAASEPTADRTPDRDADRDSDTSTSRTGTGRTSEESGHDRRDSAAAEAEAGVGEQSSDAGARSPEPESRATDARATRSETTTAQAGARTSERESAGADADDERTSPQSERSPEAGAEPSDEKDEQDAGSAFDEEEKWREATTIPSLDPDLSEGPDEEAESEAETGSTLGAASADGTESSDSGTTSAPSARGDAAAEAGATRQSSGKSGTSGRSEKTSGRSGSTSSAGASNGGASAGPSQSSGATSGGAGGDGEESGARARELRSQLDQRKQQVQQLKKRVSNVESERNEYKRERDALRQEVERLEAKLESAESTGSGSAKRQLDRAQAFDGTNLFVRYESKGKATLDEAAEGKVDADEVNANLRLEHHTQFEAEDVDVAGESFEAFLTDSFEYRFVSWVVEELLYEIRDTGHGTALKDLYESIPRVDRVDLHGSVSAATTDDDTRQESFDVIMRDRMGNPLLLADLNGSRDPTTGEMMGSLVDASSGVGHAHDELAGAFQVTESFFEPEALETADSATSGGFLTREKRQSFVKLSRKRGYHLCLVESRSGGFHLNVPEL